MKPKLNILKTLVCYRLLHPGSEWRLHREWYGNSAMGDLLGDESEVVSYQNLYRCLDKLTEHKEGMFTFLKQRWQDMFNAGFEVLLYDLTSTYFECDPPETGKRRFGYSRDKRSDCVQVVIALIVTPEGFPLCYEVLSGNTSDKTTLREFLDKIEKQYGKARRVWVMDRGIPTEEVLAEMRQSPTPVETILEPSEGTTKTKIESRPTADENRRGEEGSRQCRSFGRTVPSFGTSGDNAGYLSFQPEQGQTAAGSQT